MVGPSIVAAMSNDDGVCRAGDDAASGFCGATLTYTVHDAGLYFKLYVLYLTSAKSVASTDFLQHHGGGGEAAGRLQGGKRPQLRSR